MTVWLQNNIGNIIVSAILIAVVALIIRGMIRDKKAGKSSCGGNCASCGLCGSESCSAAQMKKDLEKLKENNR
jgi:hypothetical protein